MLTFDDSEISEYLGGSLFGVGWVQGRMVAALGLEAYSGTNVWAHIKAEIPAREWVLACLRLVFVTLGCERVSMIVRDNNSECIRLMKTVGAELECVIRRGHICGDDHLYVLWRGTGIHRRLAGKL